MEVDNFIFIKNNIKENQVLMSLDVSKNNLGIALSSVGLKLALPKLTIVRGSFDEDLTKIKNLILKYDIFALVVGLPLNSDGSKNQNTQAVNSFCSLLKKHLSLPIYMQDERFSTKYLINSTLTKNKAIDESSAAWFLQIFLDKLHKV
jgi:putative Holliday junction resolvase